ncbi:kinetochore-associated Ndc80 complex subunit ndc80 [Ordospora colligata]|uniref:Kinetochore protein NDC80 n=1 Tax=Ordospora colligata OC4 TaxID=1354746 RepID=A0A0B2UKW6_9MICR|nr:chromosome segregation protein [Ordospora colligata OC4]KHN69667.1 chromosome segregation protein [Ordospora colligata OC4]TBU15786.1 chromosome segregation protein [Ordospora colligata]TBU15914.1 chromosome segregation protein [Ordospora colligata]
MMRRFTMTPNSRNPVKTPVSGMKATPFPRHSLGAEEVRRRDARVVREKGYVQQCVDGVHDFLVENGYEGVISHKVLHNPSSKDFQSIFKFLYGFIDDIVFSTRFEDDVVNVMKSLRYPYCGEITKSQLAAITPHTWPVILSMCYWLVELVKMGSMENEEGESGVDGCFFEYVCEGYLRFMEGGENEGDEEEFERKVMEIYTEMFSGIDKRKEELRMIETKIAGMGSALESREQLEGKKKELADDLNMLIASEKQLEGKKRKYAMMLEKICDEICKVEEEIECLRRDEEELRGQITRQRINPEDVKEMNVEKIELFKELERMKPEKEGLMKYVGMQERELHEMIEDVEKLCFDLKGLRDDISLRYAKEGKTEQGKMGKIVNEANGEVYEEGISRVIVQLEDEMAQKEEAMVSIEMSKNVLEETNNEKEGMMNELGNRFKYCNDKLVTAGKLYLEKKEISESGQRRSKTEMEMLENELLKLNLESSTSLLMSEQKLQKARIQLDRTFNNVNYEREEISKMIFNFYNTMSDVYVLIQSQVEELRGLVEG